jgi:hypothetical protein
MIHIDFQGGAHGNFLEFVCNTIAGVVVPDTLPFNTLGASHSKSYRLPKVFTAWHYSYTPHSEYPKLFNKIISIHIEPDDLLPLNQVSLLRAGDHGHDNDHLEVDTFNKLNNIPYRWVLDQLTDGFFTNQIRRSYDAVKDPSWPDVTSLDEFNQLPEHIRTECIQQHGLVLLELSEKNPDCPRFVLREFFEIGFKNPSQHGFIARQKTAVYDVNDDVYTFPFRCFYNKTEFLNEIKKVAAWAEITFNCENEILHIHKEFLTRQPYKNSKQKCDDIVKKINLNVSLETPKLTLLEEAYVNAALGRNYYQ